MSLFDRFWYSTWRRPLLAVLAVLTLGTLVLLTISQQGTSSPQSAPTTTLTGTPTTMPSVVWSLAPLPEEQRFPAGGVRALTRTAPSSEQLAALSRNLKIGKLKSTQSGWARDGLTMTADGTWSYTNKDVIDLAAAAGCTPGAICTPPPGGTMPAPATPTADVDTVTKRALAVFSDQGFELNTINSFRDAWRDVISVTIAYEGVVVAIGRVVFDKNGVVLSANGVTAGFDVTETYFENPPAAEQFDTLDSDAVRIHVGSRTPAATETVRTTFVFRYATEMQTGSTALLVPRWAYQDEYNNVWTTSAALKPFQFPSEFAPAP